MSAAHRVAIPLVMLLALGCGAFHEVQEVDTLYFGIVSDEEWRAFVDEVITPRFPGFTEIRAEGHWKGQREPTRIVQIIHPPRPTHDRHINEIIATYKQRFNQESVLLVRSRALAIF